MTFDWAGLSRLVPELALVTLFIWFILKRDELDRVSRKENAELDRSARLERDTDWRDFLTGQRTSFTEALLQVNQSHRDGMARLAEEVKTMTVLQSAMNQLLVAHDQSARAAIDKIMQSDKPK
mgnify:CR=1 FL=1